MLWKKTPGYYGRYLDNSIEALRCGDLSQIPWIFCVFSETHDPSKLAAARALNEILGILTFGDIIRVDAQMRQTTSAEWSINWREYQLDDFFTPKMTNDERRAVCIFASFSPNGFIREKAVHAMKALGGTLPYIVLRQNDWVGRIRYVAYEAALNRLKHLTDGELLAALPFADKMKRSGRIAYYSSIEEYKEFDWASYANLFFEALTAQENEPDLINGFDSENLRVRRMCTEALFSVTPPKTEMAFRRLICEPEPFLRASIFRRLNSLGGNMDEAAGLFLRDKFPPNRALAFRYLLDSNAKDIRDVAEKLLLDKNAMVRGTAQNFIQKQAPDFDFHSFYLNNIKQFPVSAICGLGEKGPPSDTDIIEDYLGDARIDVVRAAMVALMRLDGAKYSPVLVEMLNDGRAGIVKSAQKLIQKNDRPNYDRVKEIFEKAKFLHSRLKCMDILFTAPKWQRLIYMLEMLFIDEEQIKEKAIKAMLFLIPKGSEGYQKTNHI